MLQMISIWADYKSFWEKIVVKTVICIVSIMTRMAIYNVKRHFSWIYNKPGCVSIKLLNKGNSYIAQRLKKS